ncbi:MAG: CHAT domain-containing tetratricopeptide repeat protein, partial [Bacteroidota bacterium]
VLLYTLILFSFYPVYGQNFDKVTRQILKTYNTESVYDALDLANEYMENTDSSQTENISYAKFMNTIAFMQFKNGMYDGAEKYYLKTIDILEKSKNTKSTEYSDAKYNLAILYQTCSNYVKSEPLFIEIVQIKKDIFGEKSNEYYESLIDLSNLYTDMGNYSNALSLLEDAFKIITPVNKRNSGLVLYCLRLQASIYNAIEEYSNAESVLLNSLEMSKQYPGRNKTEYIYNLQILAELYIDMKKFQEAESLLKVAKENIKVKYLEDNASIAEITSDYGMLNVNMNKYQDAENYYLQTIDIYNDLYAQTNEIDYLLSAYSNYFNLSEMFKKTGDFENAENHLLFVLEDIEFVLETQNMHYAFYLSELADLYVDIGRFKEADSLYKKVQLIYLETIGENHPEYAEKISLMARMYNKTGEYQMAESLFTKALNIMESKLGKKHSLYAANMGELGVFYLSLENYSKAEPLIDQAMEIYHSISGEGSPSYASLINAKCIILDHYEKYDEIDSLLNKALKIYENCNGIYSRDYAINMANISSFYRNNGNFNKAEELLTQSSEILYKMFGESNPDYASVLSNIAFLHKLKKEFDESESIYNQILEINKNVFGKYHESSLNTLYNLATIYFLKNDNEKSSKMFIECLEIANQIINKNFLFLSEKEKELYFSNYAFLFSQFYSYALLWKNPMPQITINVYNNIVRNKGIMLRSSTALRYGILKSKDQSLMALYNEWIDLRREINRQLSMAIGIRSKDLELIESQAEEIEKKLIRQSTTFSNFEKSQEMTWDSIKNCLKENEAAVEFVHFPIKNNSDSIIYCALIVKANSYYPEMVKLFEEKEILQILNSSKGNNMQKVNAAYGTNAQLEKSLYEAIWQPMEEYLTGIKTIYYSPDGILHKISFPSIRVNREFYLSDIYNLNQLSNTASLIHRDQSPIEDFEIGLFGGIEYSTDSNDAELWNFLPGTLKEINIIADILKNENITLKYFSGIDANETNLKKIAAKCNILHISTHGFFNSLNMEPLSEDSYLSNPDENIVFRSNNLSSGLSIFENSRNPLLRSGLVMARANSLIYNNISVMEEDGIFTAQEATSLDMYNTDLVVLSACETGLGDIKGSEGVYGLQRAFKMAGVKYIIMSLWQVPDKETVEFMEIFYKKLLKIKDVRTAFTETQKEMRNKYDQYFWGAFVLIE